MSEAVLRTTPLGHRIRTDENGKQVVEIPIREYNEMLERIEDACDIAIIDERLNDPTVPWEEMKKRLKANGRL
ncbi:MAG: hypothetical protein ABSB21_03155 [Halobacteriota archaeon]